MSKVKSVIPTLRVEAVDRSLPLYRALGFAMAWQHQLEPGAPRLTCVQRDSLEVFLTEHPVAPFGGVVYFVVEGLDGLVRLARSAGFEPSFGPERRPWGDREAYFTDTDHNVLRFGEPDPPASP